MYLRKIEMKGFKSFADQTKVGFESGITCIVGPNGSGKSNITDAIRWVLGEQKVKSLRSQKMEDVIFNGTKARSSVGLAEVALVFDNTEGYFPLDFKEVKVQRKVYRSGESEYKINNTVCRLRDIRELFMDTGIGTDGYSIIGQGQIDDLLSKNREDRRLLFEEAAGISKYKAKKKVAERKLAKTEENLIRVEDILSELKKRRDPLKKQAEKAKRYLELSEKLKKKYLKRIAADFEALGEKQGDLQKKREALREGLEDQLARRERYETEIEALDRTVSEKNEAIERGGQILRDLEEVISDLKTTVTLNEEKITEINRRFTEMEQDLKRREEEHGKRQSEQRDLVKDLEAIDASLALTEEKLAAHRQMLAREEEERASQVTRRDQLIDQIEEHRRAESKLANEREVLLELLADDERRAQEQADDLAGQESESRTLAEQLKEQEEEQEARVEKRHALLQELTGVKEGLEKARGRRRQLEASLRETEVKREKMRNERQLLTGYEAAYEGYDYTVKRLMGYLADRPEEKQRALGVVAELVEVPKTYEKAIETALGRSLQYVVSERLSDVKHLIRLLKENRMGRTSFIPLDEIRDRSVTLNNKVLAEDGLLGRGVDLVRFAPDHQKLFGYLLGHILVVRDFETAETLVKKHRIRQRVVTLDGDIINPGGIVTGGAASKGRSSGILERKRKIAQLKAELKAMDEELRTYRKDLEEARVGETELSEVLEGIAREKETLDYRIEVQGAQIDQVKRSIEKFDKERDRDVHRLNDLHRMIDQKRASIEEKASAIEALQEKRAARETERQALEASIASIDADHEKAREKAVALEIDRTRDLESKQFKMTTLRKLEIEIKEDEASLERRFADHARLREEKIALGEQLDEARASIDQKWKEKEAVESGRKRTIGERDAARADLAVKREENRSLIESLEVVREEEHSLSLALTKIEGNLEHLKEEVYERYNLSIASAFENYRDLDLSDIEEDEKSLKTAITRLGSVNLDAIEEFEEVEERFTFLSGQMDDLLAAKKELLGVVRTLDKQMKSQFLEHFEKVRVAFTETFTDLFNGGFCDLELTDPEDVLETDIAIVAQPPGKKLQSIDLLSGGEKALTAISLLFAILKIKPAPFCVLDEIEAALDDVNVYRFSDFLKKMTDRSQFLVITHRKGTMEIADALYGITMEEYGISKVVSLKLEDYEGGQYA